MKATQVHHAGLIMDRLAGLVGMPSVLIKLALVLAAPLSAPAAVVVGTFGDAVWALDPTTGRPGRHSVDSSAYVYNEEKWELPVEASKWEYSGDGTKIYSGNPGSVGSYYSYIDLTQAVFSATATEWTIRISVAGDYLWVGDKAAHESPVGLDGKFFVYFGQGLNNHFLFRVDAGKNLEDTFSTTGIKLFEDSTVPGEFPPYGTSITTTGESTYKGFTNEFVTDRLTARKIYVPGSVFDIEIKYDFSFGGLITEGMLASLDYLYVGAAKSNPSGAGDLFANDHFVGDGTTSAEYDTILIIPEPATTSLLMLGIMGLVTRRRR